MTDKNNGQNFRQNLNLSVRLNCNRMNFPSYLLGYKYQNNYRQHHQISVTHTAQMDGAKFLTIRITKKAATQIRNIQNHKKC
jgi:hypothetical protein